MLNVKVKKLTENAVIPTYAKPGDAGLDLTAASMNQNNGVVQYGTGLAFEIPEGHVGLVFPRSSIYKTDLIMANSVGVIDSGYRGEVMATFVRLGEGYGIYQVGDRIAQLVIIPYPKISLVPTDGELTQTVRGATGHGSSGGSKQNNQQIHADAQRLQQQSFDQQQMFTNNWFFYNSGF